MPPGKPWAYGSMSMRNPMSRAPMNNNPMGNQAPMQPNFGRAVGAAGSTSLPYAGGSLGMAGPATAVQGMSAMRPAPVRQAPQGTPYSRAMAGNSIYGQNGIGVQRAAQNVLMQQPPGANTRMRGLNIPGMQFDPNQNAMVRAPRPQLTVNPNSERWGRMNSPDVGTGEPMTGAQSRMNTRINRMARARGVRGQDVAEWSRLSPAAIAMRQRVGQMPSSPGPEGGNPAPMGPSQPVMAAAPATGAPTVTPPAVPPAAVAQENTGSPRAMAMTAGANDPTKTAYAVAEGRAMLRPAAGTTVVNPAELQYRQQRNAAQSIGAYERSFSPQNLAESFMSGLSDATNTVGSWVRDAYMDAVQGSPVRRGTQFGPNAATGRYASPQTWRSR